MGYSTGYKMARDVGTMYALHGIPFAELEAEFKRDGIGRILTKAARKFYDAQLARN